MKTIFISILAWLAAVHPAWGCTTFGIGDSKRFVVGKSYDWDRSVGAAVTNPRGLEKTGLVVKGSSQGAKWISQYGSLTFVQHGREFPISGANEMGLVVEVMMLEGTAYPPLDNRTTVNELQWVQYQLDNFQSTAEVLGHLEDVRVEGSYAPLHYMVCDRTAQCAAIEFLAGKAVVNGGGRLQTPVLTNNTYADSLGYLSKFQGFGGTEKMPMGLGSLDRFARFAMAATEYKSQYDPVAFAFTVLGMSNYKGMWNLVYDLANQKFHFRILGGTQKSIQADSFNYSCKEPQHWISMQTRTSGDVTYEAVPYSDSLNNQLVIDGTKGLPGLTPDLQQLLIDYPATTHCTL